LIIDIVKFQIHVVSLLKLYTDVCFTATYNKVEHLSSKSIKIEQINLINRTLKL